MPAVHKRTVRDFLSDAFFARDKQTFAQVVKDAEEAIPPPQAAEGNGNGHEEPDGDEGGDKHASNIHIHVEHGAKDSVDDRLARMETAVTDLAATVTKVVDALASDELPPWLKSKADGEEGDGDGDDKEKTEDEEVKEGETGTLSMEKLTEAEPELMDADGAKKTGPMKMGDAALAKGLARLIKDVRARAEILSPGMKFPTIDAKPGANTATTLCGVRRTALSKATKDARGRFTPEMIKTMSCDSVRILFLDASDRQRDLNNHTTHHHVGDEVFVGHATQVERLKAINAGNRDFWAKQTGAIRH